MKYTRSIAVIVLTAIMSVSSFSVMASANYTNKMYNPIVVNDVGGADKKSLLDIVYGTADCKSTFHSGNSEIKSVTAVQTLEKRNTANRWSSVSGGTCSKTASAKRFLLSNSVSNLSSGCYRLKTVFTVKYKDGRSETVTVYSTEKTVK